MSSYPNRSFFIFKYSRYVILAECLFEIRVRFASGKVIGGRIINVYPFVSSDPKLLITIDHETMDIVSQETPVIIFPASVNLNIPGIISVQSITGAKPHETIRIFRNRKDTTLG